MPYITVTCPNLGNDADNEHTIELECDVDAGDSNYGADADGNRGMYIGPSLELPLTPGTCPECGHDYTEAEVTELDEAIKQAVADWHYEPDEPDYDYHEDR